MQEKFTRDSWTAESRVLNEIQVKITLYKDGIAEYYEPHTLVEFIDAKIKTLANIEANHKATKPTYFFYPRTQQLLTSVRSIRRQLIGFKRAIQRAEHAADQLVEKYKQKIDDLIQAYRDMHALESIYFTTPTANTNHMRRSLGYRVWYETCKNMAYFSQIQSLESRRHNALAQLLLATDRGFIDSVDSDYIAIDGEIGLLIIQRLQDIFYKPSSSEQMKKIAIQVIKRTMASHTTDNLLYYNEAILHQEITKLYLHAELHPQQKFAWLGTARAVDSTIQHLRPLAMYFNPPRHFITWGLNRLWLQAAVSLGYEFHLIEQHFPSIEKSLLSQKPVKYITQLLLETRSNSMTLTSQYNGNYSCTATNQEILALIDMGCTAYKNDIDHSIRFIPPRSACTESASLSTSLIAKGIFGDCPIKRVHSDTSIEASSPPPYDDWRLHFVWN